MAKAPKICATCGAEYERDALFCPKDGTPLGGSRTQAGEDPYIGLVIANQIELRQLIGIGSMGRVYRAFQRGVERDVAVKMLHRELSANSTLVGRFLREARVASRLTHPNVVQVLMSGQLPVGPSDCPTGNELYIVMEYLDGISLMSALAASDGAIPLPRALHIVLQICDAVGEAHAQGIVHRDLKPENVMLVRRGDDSDFVKVLDFGIARFNWGEEAVTQAGLIFGTARYISPEGAQGEPVEPPADVYAIATILYQCLAGRTPFDHDSSVTLLMQHAHETPSLITSVARASYVPAPIAGATMRNLCKRAVERSPDARTFGRELVDAAKASGMSPDELVMRSTLLGQSVRGSATFLSIQRTKQLKLSSETEALIGAHGSTVPQPSTVGATANAPGATVAAAPAELATAPALSNRTGTANRLPVSPSRVTVGPSSDLDPTLDDDDVALARVRRMHRARLALFILMCFLGGAGVAAFGAHRLGYLGVRGSLGSTVYVERANEAMHNHRWNSPAQDNVRDITDEGLGRFPNDPALLEVRQRAAEDLVATALGRKYSGDIAEALNLARLAHTLDPLNTTAQHLVVELEALQGDVTSASGSKETGAPQPSASDSAAHPATSRGGHRAGPGAIKLPAPSGAQPGPGAVPPPAASSTSTPGRWL